MAPNPKQSAHSDSVTSDSNIDDADVNRFKLIIQERRLEKNKAVLYPKTLMDGMDYLKYTIDDAPESLLARCMRIEDL